MMTPTMLWTDIRITAAGHWSEVALPPYLNIIIIIIIIIIADCEAYNYLNPPDSVLCLQGEEEAGGEAVEVVHAVHVVLWLHLLEVSMVEGEEVPDHREHRPGHVEGGGEAEDGPGPGQLDGGGEEILEEPVLLASILSQVHSVHSPMLSHGKTN